MKRCTVILLLAIICVVFGGCSQSQQVESQAFVLALGVDFAPDGGYALSARMPRIAGKSNEDGAAENSSYLNVTTTGADYESALDALVNVTPRSLNLSQLKIIAFSEDVAGSGGFRALVEKISQTERLFSAARIVVCKGSARSFVNALEPAFGTRLSKAIMASFDHFEVLGTVPASSLADLCYRMESFYSDPMTAYAQTGMPDHIESEIPVSYTGAALFSDGRLVGTLDALECRIAALITGSASSIWMTEHGQMIRLIQISPPRVKLDLDSDPMRIDLTFALSVGVRDSALNADGISDEFAGQAMRAIAHTQSIGAEPFGFSEIAAKNFDTIRQFTDFDFKSRYRNAKIRIQVDLKEMTA